jgi:excisionase family DNA binding protein
VAEKEQFYSFEEALKELRLKEEELKRLVSEGEIRAFREGDTMRLRRADVETLRKELGGGEVVDLGDVQEDLVFEDDVPVAEDAGMATQEIGMATEELGEAETVIEEPAAEEEAAAAPVQARAPRAAAAAVAEDYEGGVLRALLVLTSVVLIVGLPLALAISTGKMNAVAGAVAGLFR